MAGSTFVFIPGLSSVLDLASFSYSEGFPSKFSTISGNPFTGSNKLFLLWSTTFTSSFFTDAGFPAASSCSESLFTSTGLYRESSSSYSSSSSSSSSSSVAVSNISALCSSSYVFSSLFSGAAFGGETFFFFFGRGGTGLGCWGGGGASSWLSLKSVAPRYSRIFSC